MKIKRLISVAVFATMALSFCAAQQKEWKGELGTSFEFKNKEYWRGLPATDNLTYLPSIWYEVGNWYFNVYGIFDSHHTYKEVDYEVAYTLGDFSFHVADYYMPEVDQPWTEFGNLKPKETPHYLDVFAEYAPESFPFRALIATCPFGCDIDDNGKFCWSSYAEIGSSQELPFGIELAETVGAALNRGMFTDYEGKGINFTNIKAELSKSFEFAEISFPLNLACIWNPYLKDVFFTVSFGVSL